MGLEFYYGAFIHLSTARPVGWGLSSIPETYIDEYATRRGLDEDEAADLSYLIRCMDRAFLDYHQSQTKG